MTTTVSYAITFTATGATAEEYAALAAEHGVETNWVIEAGKYVICGTGITSAVREAAEIAGKEYAPFDGTARPGFTREARQAIAAYLGLKWQDVRAHRRCVWLDSETPYSTWN